MFWSQRHCIMDKTFIMIHLWSCIPQNLFLPSGDNFSSNSKPRTAGKLHICGWWFFAEPDCLHHRDFLPDLQSDQPGRWCWEFSLGHLQCCCCCSNTFPALPGVSQSSSQTTGSVASITTAGNLRLLKVSADNITGSWSISIDSTSPYTVKVTGGWKLRLTAVPNVDWSLRHPLDYVITCLGHAELIKSISKTL